MLLVLARDRAREVRSLKLFHDAVEVGVQVLHEPKDSLCQSPFELDLLFAVLLEVEEQSLDGDEAEEEAEAHVELRRLEVDVLLPDWTRLHVLAHTLDSAFKHLFDLGVCLAPQKCAVVLQERQVVVPQVDL